MQATVLGTLSQNYKQMRPFFGMRFLLFTLALCQATATAASEVVETRGKLEAELFGLLGKTQGLLPCLPPALFKDVEREWEKELTTVDADSIEDFVYTRRKALNSFKATWKAFEGASYGPGKLVYQVKWTKHEQPPPVWGQLSYELAIYYDMLPLEGAVKAVDELLAEEEEAYSADSIAMNMFKMIGNTLGDDYIADMSALGHVFKELQFPTVFYEEADYVHFSTRAMLRAAMHVYKAGRDAYSKTMVQRLVTMHMTSLVHSSMEKPMDVMRHLCSELPLKRPTLFAANIEGHALAVELTRTRTDRYRSRVFNTDAASLNRLDESQLKRIDQGLIIPYTEFEDISMQDLEAAGFHIAQHAGLSAQYYELTGVRRASRPYAAFEFQPAQRSNTCSASVIWAYARFKAIQSPKSGPAWEHRMRTHFVSQAIAWIEQTQPEFNPELQLEHGPLYVFEAILVNALQHRLRLFASNEMPSQSAEKEFIVLLNHIRKGKQEATQRIWSQIQKPAVETGRKKGKTGDFTPTTVRYEPKKGQEPLVVTILDALQRISTGHKIETPDLPAKLPRSAKYLLLIHLLRRNDLGGIARLSSTHVLPWCYPELERVDYRKTVFFESVKSEADLERLAAFYLSGYGQPYANQNGPFVLKRCGKCWEAFAAQIGTMKRMAVFRILGTLFTECQEHDFVVELMKRIVQAYAGKASKPPSQLFTKKQSYILSLYAILSGTSYDMYLAWQTLTSAPVVFSFACTPMEDLFKQYTARREGIRLPKLALASIRRPCHVNEAVAAAYPVHLEPLNTLAESRGKPLSLPFLKLLLQAYSSIDSLPAALLSRSSISDVKQIFGRVAASSDPEVASTFIAIIDPLLGKLDNLESSLPSVSQINAAVLYPVVTCAVHRVNLEKKTVTLGLFVTLLKEVGARAAFTSKPDVVKRFSETITEAISLYHAAGKLDGDWRVKVESLVNVLNRKFATRADLDGVRIKMAPKQA